MKPHPNNKVNRVASARIAAALSISIIVVLWWLGTVTFQLIPSLFLPSPLELLNQIKEMGMNLPAHAITTLVRVLLSFLLGSTCGVLLGLIMSRFPLVYGFLDPIIEALRPIPPVALVPFFILWFGIGNLGKILLAGLGCFMVLVISTIEATRNVPSRYLNAARSLGASDAYAYRTVVVPSIVPELIAASRVSLALAFGLTVAAELMGAQAGLGFIIMVARRSLNTATILLGITVIGLEAWACDRLLRRFAFGITKWSERSVRVRI